MKSIAYKAQMIVDKNGKIRAVKPFIRKIICPWCHDNHLNKYFEKLRKSKLMKDMTD
jgi:hypothetical protein|tara:strand:- start:359 stop:529 length:171 start_codon:yes stop_codon:yes gene_type:complete